MKKIFLFIVLLHLLSCEKSNPNDENESKYTNVQIYDSISIPSPRIECNDYFDNKYLFFSRITGDIFVYDRNIRKLYQFNHYGGGEKEYSRISNLMYFWKDSLIVVGDQKSIVFYSYKGDFVKRININRETAVYPIRNIFELGDSCIIYRDVQYQPNWYKESTKRFVKLNFINSESFNFMDFPLEGIDYYKNLVKIKDHSLNILAASSENKLYVTTGANSNILEYDLKSLKLLNVIKLSLDYFKQSYTGIADSPNFKEVVKNSYEFSQKIKFFTQSDTIYVLYNVPFTNKEMEEISKESNDFQKLSTLPDFDIAISVYKAGEKIKKDIKINKKYGMIYSMKDLSNILFNSTVPSAEEDSLGITVFKIGKLLFNEK